MDVVLLHGFAATNFTWRHIVGPLEAVHRVVALERQWISLGESVAATERGMDQHQAANCVLVGHSAGAELALAVAAAAPDRVRGMVLIAPVVGSGPPPLVRLIAKLPGSETFAPPLLRASMQWLPRALRLAWYDGSAVSAEIVEGYRRPLLKPGVAEALWTMAKHDDEGILGVELTRPQQPSLIVVGSADRFTGPLEITGARTVVLDRCGHLPQEEQPARLVIEILRFVEDLESGSSPRLSRRHTQRANDSRPL